MTSLKDSGGEFGAASAMMPHLLGHTVLKSKANLSRACEQADDVNGDMDRMSETEERAAFIRRVKMAREARYPTQKPMCLILGIEQGTYKQYETRTPLPHRFIPKFCAATGVQIRWLLTGEGRGPVEVAQFDQAKPAKPKRKARSRGTRAA